MAEKAPVDGDTPAVELAVVGFCVVAQHIPTELRVPHPSEVTFPPELAEFEVILLTVEVASILIQEL